MGGGSEVLVVETLVFDKNQITSKQNGNRPTWGGCCHTLSAGNASAAWVIIKEIEKNELSESNRSIDSRSVPWQL